MLWCFLFLYISFHYSMSFRKKIVSLFKGRSPKDRGIFLFVFEVLRPQTPDSTFPTIKLKSRGKRALSKNFSVILSVCWFTEDDWESLHPILLDSFCIFLSVISMRSDKWKIFGCRLFYIIFNYYYW
jgi:hypothetical protein